MEQTSDSSESSDQSPSQIVTGVQGGGPNGILQSISFKIGVGVGGAILAAISIAVIAVVVVMCAVWRCRDRKELPIGQVVYK